MRRKSSLGHAIVYCVVLIGAVAMLFPLLWTVSTSLKTPPQLVVTRIELIPNPVAWWNYVELLGGREVAGQAMGGRIDLPRYFTNTMTIVVCAQIGALIMCSLVAYGFAWIDFPGRDIMFIVLLSTMMLPGAVTLIPYYIMWDRLGLINTFYPLIIPRFLAHNSFYIFLMRQFFQGLPRDLFDAAYVDGCNDFEIWWRIMLPLAKPVLATVSIFSFQSTWNDFMLPLVYLGANKQNWTLALGLNALKGFQGEVSTHYQMAYAVIMIIPMIMVFALGQRHIIQGVTFSGIKG